jgi:perosamine synthetase
MSTQTSAQPRTNDTIGISKVLLPPGTLERVAAVLASGHLAQGAEVEHLEAEAARMAGTAHAVAVSNGTVSLQLALTALGLEPGSVVLTSAFTFAGTLNAVLNAGMAVRFADIGDDYLIDPTSINERIDDRTAVLMPVHLYGLACDMGQLVDIAADNGLAIIEDAAQAHGARWGGQPVGGFGIGSFSLYATKNVTSGEGGLVTTNDGDVAHRLRILRNQGMRGRYEFESVGTNARMTDLQAAIAIPQIRQLDQINAQRRSNAARLAEGLADLPGILCPPRFDDPGHVMHQFTIRITGDAPISRAQLAERLGAAGISTGVYYPRPAFDYEVYRNHPRVLVDSCPHAEQLSSEVLSLPVHPGLTDSDLDRIVASLTDALGVKAS